MDLPGLWMPKSETALYRSLPKYACSSIGQLLYFSDHGHFFQGEFHRLTTGLHKWDFEASRNLLMTHVTARTTLTFSCVRNPYARIVSAFLDKICNPQDDGMLYSHKIHEILSQAFGLDPNIIERAFYGDPEARINAFRRFLVFIHDCTRSEGPGQLDIHWRPMATHLGDFIRQGGRFDKIIWVEYFDYGMGYIFDHLSPNHRPQHVSHIKFNKAATASNPPIEAYFDQTALFLMERIYQQDFELFGYRLNDPKKRESRARNPFGPPAYRPLGKPRVSLQQRRRLKQTTHGGFGSSANMANNLACRDASHFTTNLDGLLRH